MLPLLPALRRALVTVITFAIAVTGAGVAVLAAPPAPAAAAEGACPFYGDPPVHDTRWVNLDVTEPGWQVEFIDGVPSADSSANKKPPRHIETGGFAESLAVDANWLSILGGTTSLEYRWYSDSIAPADPATITLDTPYTCSVAYPDPQPQTISGFSSINGTSRRANQPVTLNATASSGLAVTYSTDTPAVCSVAGKVLSFSRAGTCTVRASQAGNADWLPAPELTQTLTATLVPQIFTGVPTYADARMGTEVPYPPDPASVTTSGHEAANLGIGWSLDGDCSFNDAWDAIRLDRVGTCQVVVIAYGDTYWDDTTLIRTFRILPEQVTQTVTVGTLADMRVGDTAQTITSTTSSGLAATYTSRTTSVCTVSNGKVTPVAAGACTVRASQAGGTVGDYEYGAATQDASFTVRGAYQAQTLTMTDLSGARLNVTPTVTVTSNTTLPFDVASTTPAVCRVAADKTTITLLDTGTCTVRATADAGTVGADDYTAATPVERSFVVLPEYRTQTVSATTPADTRLDGTPPGLSASASSGRPVTLASTTTSVCSVSNGQLTLLHAGTCRVTATQAGGVDPDDHKLEWAPQTATVAFAVLPRLQSQTITVAQPPTLRAPQTLLLTPTVDSGRAVGLASSTPAVCSVSTTIGSTWRISSILPGTCTITATASGATSGDVEYVAADPVTRSFDVWPASMAQTITFPTPTAMRLSDHPQELTATATSELPVAYRVTTPAVCSVADGAVTAIAAGTCTVTATQPGNVSATVRDVYAAASPVQKSFQVRGDLVAQTITFPVPDDMRVGDDDQTLATSASSGLSVTVTATTPETCDVSGGAVVAVAPGDCTLRAVQSGGTRVVDDVEVDYAAAASVERTLTIRPTLGTQQIELDLPGHVRVGAVGVDLDATATSGLPVTLVSDTPAVCTVTGTTLVAVRSGECSVTASQTGGVVGHGAASVEYVAATPVTRTVTVGPRVLDQTITHTAPSRVRAGDAPRDLGVTASSGLPVDLVSTTPATCTVGAGAAVPTAVGTCVLTATQAGGLVGPDATRGDTVEYRAAAPVTISFEVVTRQVAQTIRVRGERGVALSARTAPVTFTSSAGLPVKVTSRTPRVCAVEDGDVRLLAAGGCQLTATADGNDDHTAAEPVVARFPVWAAPVLPRRATTLRIVDALGRGEDGYRVTAGPADVCVTVRSRVVLSAAGRCTVAVRDGGRLVRSARITVAETRGGQDTGPKGMDLAGSVRFASGSAALSPAAKQTLRHLAPRLRSARLVVVYGNTAAYGGGDTAANRELSRQRARAVASFLRSLHVRTRSMTVGMASRNPVSRNDDANRRADVYWLR